MIDDIVINKYYLNNVSNPHPLSFSILLKWLKKLNHKRSLRKYQRNFVVHCHPSSIYILRIRVEDVGSHTWLWWWLMPTSETSSCLRDNKKSMLFSLKKSHRCMLLSLKLGYLRYGLQRRLSTLSEYRSTH